MKNIENLNAVLDVKTETINKAKIKLDRTEMRLKQKDD